MTSSLVRVLTVGVGAAVLAWSSVTAQSPAEPMKLTTQEDHQRTMKLLGLESLPRGASGSAAETYIEADANPYPTLPDPLTFADGRRVATAAQWPQRRAEILTLFEREVYGRRPAQTPQVTWEVTATTTDTENGVAVVTRQLVGHVDNASYPAITVAIQASLTTPARADGPVPVVLQFGGRSTADPAANPCAPPGGFPARGAAPAGRGAPGAGWPVTI